MRSFLYNFFLAFIGACCCFLFKATAAERGDTAAVNTNSKLPVIGIGYGALTFIGDMGSTGLNEPVLYRGGLQLEVQLHSKTNFAVFFNLLAGKVYGQNQSPTNNANFMSNILMEGANIRYSFNFKKYPHQVLIPFVSIGIEALSFNPYTDLKDANGNTYYYWTDGTIRNMPQTTTDASQATILHRDYIYETNIRDADVAGAGNFNEFAFAVPISVGVKFKISGRVALYFTEAYHITDTRYIDGSIGNPSGTSGNDKLLYSSVSFHYDLSAPRETPKRAQADETIYNTINYDSLQNADADGDGVPDFMDEDNSTPPGVKVDAHGRALDTDGDGVPDYRDKEPNSAPGAIVDENGVTITDSMQEAKYIKDSLELVQMSQSTRIRTKNDPNAPKTELPEEFQSVDLDHDGIISADEIAKAIELYTNGKSPFTKSQFYRLIDYFFAQ